MLIGTFRGGWTTSGTEGTTVMWYSPWNLPIPSKLSGYCAITVCLFLIGVELFGCLQGSGGLLSGGDCYILRLNLVRLSSMAV